MSSLKGLSMDYNMANDYLEVNDCSSTIDFHGKVALTHFGNRILCPKKLINKMASYIYEYFF